ncbi:MAG: hypothetical protein ACI87N_000573 [Flavobacteriales bacterium]|jgi:hypothetical protein
MVIDSQTMPPRIKLGLCIYLLINITKAIILQKN